MIGLAPQHAELTQVLEFSSAHPIGDICFVLESRRAVSSGAMSAPCQEWKFSLWPGSLLNRNCKVMLDHAAHHMLTSNGAWDLSTSRAENMLETLTCASRPAHEFEEEIAMSVYKVIELIGTSPNSWEEAAKNAVERAAESLRELRVAEVVSQDLVITDGKVEAYRAKVSVSFKYEDSH